MRSLGLILLLLWSGNLLAQNQNLRIDPTRVMDNSNGIIFELKPRPINPGAQYHYIVDDYRPGGIHLVTGNTLSNVPIRYDIMRNRMEIVFEDEIKVLYASKIDSFYWYNASDAGVSKFIRCSTYPSEEHDLKGFLQIRADGPLTLASYTYLKVYPATSSVALSGSHRSHNIFKKEDFFLIRENELVPFPKKRKEALLLMQDHRNEIKQFMRSKGLVLSRKQDLIKILRHYNSLKTSI